MDFHVGRAGRYKSKFPVGEVTCLKADDLPLLHSSLSSPSPTLEVIRMFVFRLIPTFAGIFPFFIISGWTCRDAASWTFP